MLVDIELIKDITGQESDAIVNMYVDSIIQRTERMLGYQLAETQRVDYIRGVGCENVWLLRKPLNSIVEVKYDGEVISTTNYKLRIQEVNKPRIILEFKLCDNQELEVESIAGYTDYNGDTPVPIDFTLFIAEMINSYDNAIDNAGLSNYKIDTISYTFSNHLENSMQFSQKINEIFGGDLL